MLMNEISANIGMFHEARPVQKGSKYGANIWVHHYDYQTASDWGCTGSFDEHKD